ncbi:hypothetical protein [Litoreibacter ponti]|nr:hypothetical protein [Litoreibacter ponti]
MPQMKGPGPIVDLVDFYHRWPTLKGSMQALANDPQLCPEEQETLNWLILLADRVGPADLRD